MLSAVFLSHSQSILKTINCHNRNLLEFFSKNNADYSTTGTKIKNLFGFLFFRCQDEKNMLQQKLCFRSGDKNSRGNKKIQ